MSTLINTKLVEQYSKFSFPPLPLVKECDYMTRIYSHVDVMHKRASHDSIFKGFGKCWNVKDCRPFMSGNVFSPGLKLCRVSYKNGTCETAVWHNQTMEKISCLRVISHLQVSTFVQCPALKSVSNAQKVIMELLNDWSTHSFQDVS